MIRKVKVRILVSIKLLTTQLTSLSSSSSKINEDFNEILYFRLTNFLLNVNCKDLSSDKFLIFQFHKPLITSPKMRLSDFTKRWTD